MVVVVTYKTRFHNWHAHSRLFTLQYTLYLLSLYHLVLPTTAALHLHTPHPPPVSRWSAAGSPLLSPLCALLEVPKVSYPKSEIANGTMASPIFRWGWKISFSCSEPYPYFSWCPRSYFLVSPILRPLLLSLSSLTHTLSLSLHSLIRSLARPPTHLEATLSRTLLVGSCHTCRQLLPLSIVCELSHPCRTALQKSPINPPNQSDQYGDRGGRQRRERIECGRCGAPTPPRGRHRASRGSCTQPPAAGGAGRVSRRRVARRHPGGGVGGCGTAGGGGGATAQQQWR